VIKASGDPILWLWGPATVDELAANALDLVPFTIDGGWLYCRTKTTPRSLLRLRLDTGARESLIPLGGPDGADTYAIAGDRLVYTNMRNRAARVRLIDLATRKVTELGEVDTGKSLAPPVAIGPSAVFVGDARHDGSSWGPFLPETPERIDRLQVIGEMLFWSTLDETGDGPPTTRFYRADAKGEPLPSPPAGDERPPFL
jgi:hypothetical protein